MAFINDYQTSEKSERKETCNSGSTQQKRVEIII